MSSRIAVAAVVLAGLTLGAARPAAAERRLVKHYRRDVPVTAVGVVLYAAAELAAKDAVSPASCRWCAANGLDDGLRTALRWKSPGTPNTLSNLTGFVVAPVLSLGLLELEAALDDRRADWFHNGLILTETTVLSLSANYLVKAAVGRERPDVHQLAPADKLLTKHPAENNLSFYSGHSTLAMTLAVAAGTTAHLRGYRHEWLVWGTTVPVALATGYLRIAAERHWSSDVLTGWVVGAGFGVAIPYLLHTERGEAAPMPVVSRSGGVTSVGLAGAW
ncbi:MAG: phosphatase PAP2 family protein [Kofleriaceae bacterium]